MRFNLNLLAAVILANSIGGIAHATATEPSTKPPAFSLQMPLPKGPFATWPEASKEPAIRALAFRCMMVGTMALGSYSGPKDAAVNYAKAFMMSCVLGQMPADWHDRAKVGELEKSYFATAHEQDPTLTFPIFPSLPPSASKP
jgi:hypothetical protein